MNPEALFLTGSLCFIGLALLLDLGVFSTSIRKVSFKNAIAWTSVWITFSFIFFLFLKQYGHLVHGINTNQELIEVAREYQPGLIFQSADFNENIEKYNDRISLDYLTGYFIEYSLSIDNLFVILLIFNSFAVPSIYHKKVLLWGIIGAIILRMTFIFAGSMLISSFHWTLYLFGAFLIFSGLKILLTKDKEEKINIEKHPIVRFTSKYFSVWPKYVKGKFIHIANGKKYLTPLFIVLLVVEFSDLIFAVDSVPAIFSVTKDPYIVFFANIFAILGLRSLFFLLSNVMHLFVYLKYGLGILLAFIGFKMLFESWFTDIGFNNVISLIVILGILSVSVILSIIFPKIAPESRTPH